MSSRTAQEFHPGPMLARAVTPASSSRAETAATAQAQEHASTQATATAATSSSNAASSSTAAVTPSPSISSHAAFMIQGGPLTLHLLLKKHKALPRRFACEMRLSGDLSKLILSSKTFHPLTLAPLPLGSDPAILEIPVYDLIDSCSGIFDCSSVLIEKHVKKAGLHVLASFTVYLAHAEHRNKLIVAYAPPGHHHPPSVSGFPLPWYFEAPTPEAASSWVRALAWTKEYAAANAQGDKRSQLLRLHRNSSLQQRPGGEGRGSQSLSQSSLLSSSSSLGGQQEQTPALLHSQSLSSSLTATQAHPPVHHPSTAHSAFSFMGDALKRAFHHPSSAAATNQHAGAHSLSAWINIHAELAKAVHHSEHEEEDLTILQPPISSPTPASQSASASASAAVTASTPLAPSNNPSFTATGLSIVGSPSSGSAATLLTSNPSASLSILSSPTSASTTQNTQQSGCSPTKIASQSQVTKQEQLSLLLTEGQAFLSYPSGRILSAPPELLFLWTSQDLTTIHWSHDRSKPTSHVAQSSNIVSIEQGISSPAFGLDKWIFSLTLKCSSASAAHTPAHGSQSLFGPFGGGGGGANGTRPGSFSSLPGSGALTTPHTPSAQQPTDTQQATTLVTLHLAAESPTLLRLWLYSLKWLRDFKSNVSTPYNVQRIAWMDTNLTWGGSDLFKVFGIDTSSTGSKKGGKDSLIKLGGGGMANVYLITHSSTKQQFALKVFHSYPEVILSEIEVMKSLKHPNCIQYFGCIPRGKELYVVMEYCDHGSLKDFLVQKAREKLREVHIAYIMKQVLHALQYLHSLSLLHRDIKCANILLTKRGEVKIGDFGISGHFLPKSSTTIPANAPPAPGTPSVSPDGSPTTPGLPKRESLSTSTTTATSGATPNASSTPTPSTPAAPMGIGGSPLWMSPEALRGQELGPPSDVYSLGITGIEMAEGKPPNSEMKTLFQVAQAVVTNAPPSLLTHARSYPNPSEAFQDFIDRCLVKDPEQRWTVDQLLQHPFLNGAAAGASGPGASHTPTPGSAGGTVRSLLLRGAQLLTGSFSSHNLTSPASHATHGPSSSPASTHGATHAPSPSPGPHAGNVNSNQNSNPNLHPPIGLVSPTVHLCAPPVRGGGGQVSSSAASSHSASPHSSLPGSPATLPVNRAAGAPPPPPLALSTASRPPSLKVDENASPHPGLTAGSSSSTGIAWPASSSTVGAVPPRSLAGTPTHGLLSDFVSSGETPGYGLAAQAKHRGSLHGVAAVLARSAGTSPHLSPSSSASNLHAYTLAAQAQAAHNASASPAPAGSVGHSHSNSLSLPPNAIPVSDEPDEAFISFLTYGTYTRAAANTAATGRSKSGKDLLASPGTHPVGSANRSTSPMPAASLVDDSHGVEWDKRPSLSGPGSGSLGPPNPRLLKKQSHERQLQTQTSPQGAGPSNLGNNVPASATGTTANSHGSSHSSDLLSKAAKILGLAPSEATKIAKQDPKVQLAPPNLLGGSNSTPSNVDRQKSLAHLRGQSHGGFSSPTAAGGAPAKGHARQFSKLPKLLPSLTLKRTASMSTVAAFAQARHEVDAEGGSADGESQLSPASGLAIPTGMVRGVSQPQTSTSALLASSSSNTAHPGHTRVPGGGSVILEGDESSELSSPVSRSHAMRKFSSAMPFRADSTGIVERQQSSESLRSPSALRSISNSQNSAVGGGVESPRSLQRDSSYIPTEIEQEALRTNSGSTVAASTDSSTSSTSVSEITKKPSLNIQSSTSVAEQEDECTPMRTFAPGEGGEEEDETEEDAIPFTGEYDPFSSERAMLMRKSSLNQGDGGNMGDMNASYVISSHGTLIAGNFAISAQGLHANTPADGALSRRSSVLEPKKKTTIAPNLPKRPSIHTGSSPVGDSSALASAGEDVAGEDEFSPEDSPDSSPALSDEPLSSPTHHNHALSKSDLFTLGVIGKGQNGPVLKAIHLPSLTVVAIKSIYAHDRGTRHQLLHELTAYMHFDSPYLVSFLGAYYEDSVIFLATEYMDKGSLQHFIRLNGPLLSRPRVFRQIAYQCIAGLKHMHDRHSLHRDIKPDNVLLSHTGSARLGDFGLLKDLGSTIAMSNTFLGTMSYLSPERIMSQAYSYPSDVWSMGLTFLFALTGKSPVQSADFFTMMDLITHQPPESLSPAVHGLEPDLCDFVNGMLRMDVSTRYTCDQLLFHPFLLGSAGDESVIPATHLSGDQDASVWSVDQASMQDLDLILEIMISKHLLPELHHAKSASTSSTSGGQITLLSPTLSSSGSSTGGESSHGPDSFSGPPLVTSSDGGYTTSLHSLPSATSSTSSVGGSKAPVFRLPAHLGGPVRDNEQAEEDQTEEEPEISVIETFPVDMPIPVVSSSATAPTDIDHGRLELAREVVDSDTDEEDEDDHSPHELALHLARAGAHDDGTHSSEEPEDEEGEEEVAPLSLRQMTFVRTSSMNRWLVEEPAGSSSSAPSLPPITASPDSTPAPSPHSRAVTGADGSVTQMHNESVEEDDEPVSSYGVSSNLLSTSPVIVEASVSPPTITPTIAAPTPLGLSLPATLSIDPVPMVSLADEGGDDVVEDPSQLAPPARFGLSLNISPLESVEVASAADEIAILPVDEPSDSVPVAPHPRLSMSLPRTSSLIDEDEDEEGMIQTFIDQPSTGGTTGEDASIKPSLLLSPSLSSPDSSIELLPLDGDRCICLAKQFGCSPESVQSKWTSKQREMLQRSGMH